MAEPLILRAAMPYDLELVREIGVRTYLDHYRDLWTPAGLEAYLEQQFGADTVRAHLGDPLVRYDLAYAGAELVGFAKVNRRRPVPGLPERSGSELQKIYFTAAATGRGHGAELLRHVCSTARLERERCVWLNVLESNAAGARFYGRMGFDRVGTTAFDTGRDRLAMWVMLREL
jgi:ribosomal protein S18 acetylase RimI-like enzyme